MEAKFFAVSDSGRAQMSRAARNHQTAVKTAEPIEAPVQSPGGGGNAAKTVPAKAVRTKKGIGNIQSSVDEHLVAEGRAGVDPGYTSTAAGAIVEDGSFNAAKLGGIDELGLSGQQGLSASRRFSHNRLPSKKSLVNEQIKTSPRAYRRRALFARGHPTGEGQRPGANLSAENTLTSMEKGRIIITDR